MGPTPHLTAQRCSGFFFHKCIHIHKCIHNILHICMRCSRWDGRVQYGSAGMRVISMCVGKHHNE